MVKKKKPANRSEKYFAVNIVAVDAQGKPLREEGLHLPLESAQIQSSKPLPEESKIQMKMLIPDTHDLNLVKANGTIKWFKQVKSKTKKFFLIGVHFRGLETEDMQKLIKLWKRYG